MQERSDSSFFVQLILGGKSNGGIGDCAFDGSGAAGIVPQPYPAIYRRRPEAFEGYRSPF